MIETLKVIQKKKFESYRNTFSSLALNMHILSEPMPKSMFRKTDMDIRFGCASAPQIESNKWDQIEIKGPLTLKEMNKFF